MLPLDHQGTFKKCSNLNAGIIVIQVVSYMRVANSFCASNFKDCIIILPVLRVTLCYPIGRALPIGHIHSQSLNMLKSLLIWLKRIYLLLATRAKTITFTAYIVLLVSLDQCCIYDSCH